jgi:FAD/FMN-containing dehydrogenase
MELNTIKLHDLQQRFAGRIIVPGDPSYESARRIHNLAIDRRPAALLLCAVPDDVNRAIEFARTNQCQVAVRSGGHSQVGHSVCQDGLVIDLSELNRATVDPVRRIARVQGGLHAGDFDRAAQSLGLATTLGQCPSVGIGGLATGGGFGFLTGKHGLTCDNLDAAKVITADAQTLCASMDTNADLFWALRGGGGNFGVAVELDFRLHPVGSVIGGMLRYPLARARHGFEFMRDYLEHAPDELTASFGIMPVQDGSGFAIAVCYAGDPRDGEKALAPLLSFASPISGSVRPLSYLEMQVVMGDPSPCHIHTIGGFIRELTDAVIDAILESVANNPSPSKSFFLDHYHGAMCRVGQLETAFPVREPGYGYLVKSEWDHPDERHRQVQWVHDTMSAMAPFSAGIRYVASLGDEDEQAVRTCYGPNYQRLAALKSKYDPANFFRLNQNIPPSPA